MINKNDIASIHCCKGGIELLLKDGRIGYENFLDYSRLANANHAQLEKYVLSHYGIHWPELDEDLSFDGFFNKTHRPLNPA